MKIAVQKELEIAERSDFFSKIATIWIKHWSLLKFKKGTHSIAHKSDLKKKMELLFSPEVFDCIVVADDK